MTQEIELVVFENVSVIHQKALSLPFGKVSLRQLLMLSAGMIGAVIAYSVTGEILYPAIVFGMFVALGMVSTKVLTLDQMIKSIILFLIRGTSLSKKPQYMIDEKKRTANTDNVGNDKQSNKEIPAKNKNIIQQAISNIELLFGKKSTYEEDEQIEEGIDDDDNDLQEGKRFSVDVKLEEDEATVITQLQISNMQDNYYDYSNDISNQNMLDKIINMIAGKKSINSNQNELIPEILTVYLNGTKIAATDYIVNEKDNSISIPLNYDSKYSVKVNDENNRETMIAE